jgi:hypothetical protein
VDYQALPHGVIDALTTTPLVAECQTDLPPTQFHRIKRKNLSNGMRLDEIESVVISCGAFIHGRRIELLGEYSKTNCLKSWNCLILQV